MNQIIITVTEDHYSLLCGILCIIGSNTARKSTFIELYPTKPLGPIVTSILFANGLHPVFRAQTGNWFHWVGSDGSVQTISRCVRS